MVTMMHSGVTAHLTLDVLKSTRAKTRTGFTLFDKRMATLSEKLRGKTFKGAVLGEDTSYLTERLESLLNLEKAIVAEFKGYADKLNQASQFLQGQKSVPPVGLPFEDHLITVKTSGTAGQISAMVDLLQRTAQTVLVEATAAVQRNEKSKSALGVCKQKALAMREKIAVEVYRKQLDAELRSEEARARGHIEHLRNLTLETRKTLSNGNFDYEAEVKRFDLYDLPVLEEKANSKLSTLKLKNLLDYRAFESASTIQADILREVRATHIQTYKQRV